MKKLLYLLLLLLPVLGVAQSRYGVEGVPMCWTTALGVDSSIIRYVLVSTTGKPVQTIVYENASGVVVNVSGGTLRYGFCDCAGGLDSLQNGSVTWAKLAGPVKDSIRGRKDTTVAVISQNKVVDFDFADTRRFSNVYFVGKGVTDTAQVIFLSTPATEQYGTVFHLKADSGDVVLRVLNAGANNKPLYKLKPGQRAEVRALYDAVAGTELWEVVIVWDSIVDKSIYTDDGILPSGTRTITMSGSLLLNNPTTVTTKLFDEVRQKFPGNSSKWYSRGSFYESRGSIALGGHPTWFDLVQGNGGSMYEWYNGVGWDTTNSVFHYLYGGRYSSSFISFSGARPLSGTAYQDLPAFKFNYNNGNGLSTSEVMNVSSTGGLLFSLRQDGRVTFGNNGNSYYFPNSPPSNASKRKQLMEWTAGLPSFSDRYVTDTLWGAFTHVKASKNYYNQDQSFFIGSFTGSSMNDYAVSNDTTIGILHSPYYWGEVAMSWVVPGYYNENYVSEGGSGMVNLRGSYSNTAQATRITSNSNNGETSASSIRYINGGNLQGGSYARQYALDKTVSASGNLQGFSEKVTYVSESGENAYVSNNAYADSLTTAYSRDYSTISRSSSSSRIYRGLYLERPRFTGKFKILSGDFGYYERKGSFYFAGVVADKVNNSSQPLIGGGRFTNSNSEFELSFSSDSILAYKVIFRPYSLGTEKRNFDYLKIPLEDSTSNITLFEKYQLPNATPSATSGAISNLVWTGTGTGTGNTPSFLRSQHKIIAGTTDGSGDITITFDAAMPDATYTVLVTGQGTTPYVYMTQSGTLSTGSVKVRMFTLAGAAATSTAYQISYEVKDTN